MTENVSGSAELAGVTPNPQSCNFINSLKTILFKYTDIYFVYYALKYFHILLKDHREGRGKTKGFQSKRSAKKVVMKN